MFLFHEVVGKRSGHDICNITADGHYAPRSEIWSIDCGPSGVVGHVMSVFREFYLIAIVACLAQMASHIALIGACFAQKGPHVAIMHQQREHPALTMLRLLFQRHIEVVMVLVRRVSGTPARFSLGKLAAECAATLGEAESGFLGIHFHTLALSCKTIGKRHPIVKNSEHHSKLALRHLEFLFSVALCNV